MKKELITYNFNTSSQEQILQHLLTCEQQFIPPLSEKVNILDYSKKIKHSATTCEAWYNEKLVGLLAIYCNDFSEYKAFITNVSTLPDFTGMRIATNLMAKTIDMVKTLGFREITLEVNKENSSAINLYKKCNFEISESIDNIFVMKFVMK